MGIGLGRARLVGGPPCTADAVSGAAAADGTTAGGNDTMAAAGRLRLAAIHSVPLRAWEARMLTASAYWASKKMTSEKSGPRRGSEKPATRSRRWGPG